MKEKKTNFYIFFIIMGMQCLAANFAHPVTPSLIQNLGLPDYSFGLFFAGMAFSNFLFSPMWAKLVKKYGSRVILGVCCIGYGIGQALFAIFTTIPTILFARIFSGFFVGGIMVSYMTYVIAKADDKSRGKYLAFVATCSSVFAAFGYLIGGVLGAHSIALSFVFQVVTLIISGVLFYLLLEDDKQPNVSFSFRIDSNPFKAFIDSKPLLSKSFIILLSAVFITSVATTGFDQTFNYYIKDVFNFSSSYNGIIKAIIGFTTLITNTTICVWLFNNTNTKKSIMVVLFGCSISLVALLMSQSVIIFILFALIFFAFNALYLPLLQDICIQSNTVDDSTTVAGIYNSMKSLGMIIGALYAGFVYNIFETLPFIIAAILFVLAIILLQVYSRLKKEPN